MNWRRNITLLSLFNALLNFRLYYVIAVLYFAEVSGSYALALSIYSIAQLSQAVFEVPTGVFSDKVGRRVSLIIGAVFSMASVLSYAVGYSYWFLVLGAILDGVCRALFSGNNDALLYESLDAIGEKDKYHVELGKVHSNLELTAFIGALLGGGLLVYFSYSILFWLSLLPQIACVLLSFYIVEPAQHHIKTTNIYAHVSEALSVYRQNWKLRNLSLAHVMQVGLGGASWSLQAGFYNTVLPAWLVGFVMSFNFLASAVSFRLSGWVIDKFKALNLLIYQEIYSGTLYFIALLYPTMLSPFLMAVASITYGPGEVAKNTLLQKEFTDHQRATMASLNSLLGSCFFAVSAVVLGWAADMIGPARALLIVQICLLPVLVIYWRVFRKSS